MGVVAALLVLIEAVRTWWIVIPAAGRGITWVDLVAMAAVIGICGGHRFAGISDGKRFLEGPDPCLKPSEPYPMPDMSRPILGPGLSGARWRSA